MPRYAALTRSARRQEEPLKDYAYLATSARAMIHLKAPTEAAAQELFDALKGQEVTLTLTSPDGAEVAPAASGHAITALALESGHLDQINGTPLEELCSNESCRAELNGNARDGECGHCADRGRAEETGPCRV
ncbi:hypothetical protein ACGRHY_29185 [Streptomyces sp. HK10]|uniref:hypothetical protein n=1 Tax=Streptomyces sp. HK10 TaxID=3373255 RepID=UPI0037486439